MGDSTVKALDGVDLSVNEGEFVAIMGPSGSGKSTMLSILGLLDSPTSGRMIIRGKQVSHASEDELARLRGKEIGFIFQSFFLVPTLSTTDNVALPMMLYGVSEKERRTRAKKLLEQVGLGDRADHMPSELSGGQRQRVAIARALANDPAILLADEPTGNLDSKSGAEILKLFKKLNDEGITIIIVTHDPGVASIVKRTIHLKDGVVEKEERRKKE
ncbi:ABC transporter ATP-binding protein [Candidatus Micrarchaeota archaeon]|nr:ABC transporter ATP-binding protein [Candidatus Micrarchaeota archaeon]